MVECVVAFLETRAGFFQTTRDLRREILGETLKLIVASAETYCELGKSDDVAAVLGLSSNLLSVLALDYEHDAGGLVDQHGIDALVSWPTAKSLGCCRLVFGHEGAQKPQNEQLVVSQVRIALLEVAEFAAKIDFTHACVSHGFTLCCRTAAGETRARSGPLSVVADLTVRRFGRAAPCEAA